MAANVLAKLAIEIAANTVGFGKALDNANKKLNSFERNLNTIKKAIGAAFVADALMNIGKAIINTTAEFQKFEAVLTNGLGSRSAAIGALNEITKFAAKTPFEVQELTSVFVKWTNTGLSPSIEKLGKLGDVASSLGAGLEQTAEAFKDLAVGQTRRIEEIGIVAKSVGEKIELSFKGTTIQVTKSAAGVDAALNAFSKLPGVLGASAAVSSTLNGKISNFNDNLSILAKSIGDRTSGLIGGFLDFANNAIGSVNEALNKETDQLRDQQIELNVLVRSLTNANTSEEARSRLITEINQKYPEFLAGLTNEQINAKTLTDRLTEVNQQYVKKIALAAANEKLLDIQRDITNAVTDELDAQKELQRLAVTGAEYKPGGAPGTFTLGTQQALESAAAQTRIVKAQERQKELQKDLNEALTFYVQKAEEAANLSFFKPKITTETGGGTTDGKGAIKAIKEANKKALEQDKLYQESVMALMTERQAAEFKATIDFEKSLNEAKASGFKDTVLLEQAYYAELKKIKDKYDKQELEATEKQQKEKNKLMIDAEKIAEEAFLARLTERQQAEFKAGTDFLERIKQLEEAGITDKIAIQEQYRLELLAINEKYDKEEEERAEKAAKNILKLNKKQIESLNELNEAFGNAAKQGITNFLSGLDEVAAEQISFGDNIIKALAGFMKDFGQALITIGIGKLQLDKLFTSGPAGALAAIGAGTALLLTAGAVNRGLARRAASIGAGGGSASNFSSQTVSAGMTGNITITGELKGSGRDLVAVINQTSFDNKIRKGG